MTALEALRRAQLCIMLMIGKLRSKSMRHKPTSKESRARLRSARWHIQMAESAINGGDYEKEPWKNERRFT